MIGSSNERGKIIEYTWHCNTCCYDICQEHFDMCHPSLANNKKPDVKASVKISPVHSEVQEPKFKFAINKTLLNMNPNDAESPFSFNFTPKQKPGFFGLKNKTNSMLPSTMLSTKFTPKNTSSTPLYSAKAQFFTNNPITLNGKIQNLAQLPQILDSPPIPETLHIPMIAQIPSINPLSPQELAILTSSLNLDIKSPPIPPIMTIKPSLIMSHKVETKPNPQSDSNNQYMKNKEDAEDHSSYEEIEEYMDDEI